jgi:hypothetical protein
MSSERSRLPVRLSKPELLRRLDARSRSRYGGPLSEALLNDLIKDGLVPALRRSKNEGLKPVYEASARHYRRALQIKRLMSRGVSGRDTLLVQLFLRGYGKPWEVRKALRREYARHLKSLFAKIRSTYLDTTREIGPSHKSSLRKQMGILDERFEAARLELSPDAYVELSREAKLPFDLTGLLAGWLSIDPGSGTFSDRVESALSQPNAKFLEAWDAFHTVDKGVYSRLLGARIIDDPNFATIALMQMLCCVQNGSAYDFSSVPPELKEFAFKIRDVVGL